LDVLDVSTIESKINVSDVVKSIQKNYEGQVMDYKFQEHFRERFKT